MTSPLIGSSVAHAGSNIGSGAALRMSPSRTIENTRLVKILPELGEAEHRLGHPASQYVEGDELADREVADDDQARAEIKCQRSRHC